MDIINGVYPPGVFFKGSQSFWLFWGKHSGRVFPIKNDHPLIKNGTNNLLNLSLSLWTRSFSKTLKRWYLYVCMKIVLDWILLVDKGIIKVWYIDDIYLPLINVTYQIAGIRSNQKFQRWSSSTSLFCCSCVSVLCSLFYCTLGVLIFEWWK